VAAFRREVVEADRAEQQPTAADSPSESGRAALPEFPEASRQLVESVVKVAGAGDKADLDLRYGALEALPTARRVLSGYIARLEQSGATKTETDPLYAKLTKLDAFESAYLDVVTKPPVQRGKAKVSDILPAVPPKRAMPIKETGTPSEPIKPPVVGAAPVAPETPELNRGDAETQSQPPAETSASQRLSGELPSDIKVKVQGLDRNGNAVERTMTADKAGRWLEGRSEVLRKLLDCLGRA
jgi:hypothetical protein